MTTTWGSCHFTLGSSTLLHFKRTDPCDLPFIKRRRPGHPWFFQTWAVLLRGSVTAQVPLGVGVVPLLDSDVGSGLPPEMLRRFGHTSAFPAQRGALHHCTSSAPCLLSKVWNISKFADAYFSSVSEELFSGQWCWTRDTLKFTRQRTETLSIIKQKQSYTRSVTLRAVQVEQTETESIQTLSETYGRLTANKKAKRSVSRHICSLYSAEVSERERALRRI